MKIEATITAPPSIEELARHARELDELGYDSILVPEAGHDPFLPQMILAEHTRRARIGTGIAISFPRSPFVTAQMAWDLQRFSGGRFVLGLGTQVKGHNERRYSTPWPSPPGPRLREYILCMKAIFRHFSTGEKPDFKGEHYQFTLCNSFFNPGPIEGISTVPIHVAAVNQYNCRLAGELGDGVRMHPLNTPAYIRDVIRPAVAEGAARAGRDISAVEFAINPFFITGRTEEEFEESKKLIRKHISFYAATRTYSAVMEHHGWGEIGEELVKLSQANRWEEMPALVTDEMLDTFAIMGLHEELPGKLTARYSGIVNTVNVVFGPPYAELQQRQRQQFVSLGRMLPALKQVV
ncbi:TIGR03617 family F420-dependent LLM class oxidoreductase [Denitratisoma oestradiolicum]|uniref:LLM class F420-dependent oxidoreductase n=1 Tax=Denitratisoma oestradiolicum TaxID=311182 RepID=A0A6S6XY19_9PROT|nr:TIGR03617 family F420-dependent LLM class oxidoreductase [Denitratisoma oestradiolicum]CAB1369247.1 LLM class F420-dependent oxidoreductase [Denitratisoma oestradiolicum]